MARPILKNEILPEYLKTLSGTYLHVMSKNQPEEGRDTIDIALGLERHLQTVILLRALGLNTPQAGQLDVEKDACEALAVAYQRVTLDGQNFAADETEAKVLVQTIAKAATHLAETYAKGIRVGVGGGRSL